MEKRKLTAGRVLLWIGLFLGGYLLCLYAVPRLATSGRTTSLKVYIALGFIADDASSSEGAVRIAAVLDRLNLQGIPVRAFWLVTESALPDASAAIKGRIDVSGDGEMDRLAYVFGGYFYYFGSFGHFIKSDALPELYVPVMVTYLTNVPPFIALPVYKTSALFARVSLAEWAKEVHRLQLTGLITNDVILAILSEADDPLWEGFGGRKLPGNSGLERMVTDAAQANYVEFATPVQFLETHSAAGRTIPSVDIPHGAFFIDTVPGDYSKGGVRLFLKNIESFFD